MPNDIDVTSRNVYWVATGIKTGDGTSWYNTGTGYDTHYLSVSTLPDPFGEDSILSGYQWSEYLEYVAAGGLSIPVAQYYHNQART